MLARQHQQAFQQGIGMAPRRGRTRPFAQRGWVYLWVFWLCHFVSRIESVGCAYFTSLG